MGCSIGGLHSGAPGLPRVRGHWSASIPVVGQRPGHSCIMGSHQADAGTSEHVGTALGDRPHTSWQINGEKIETVADFIFLGSKITEDDDGNHEI